jgi:hypothetical protein
LPVSNPEHAPPIPENWINSVWLHLFGHPKGAAPGESSAAGPSSIAPPLKPADGWTNVEKPLSPIPEEPKQAAQLPLTDNQFDHVWDSLFGPQGRLRVAAQKESSLAAAHPSSSSLPSGPADGRTDVKEPLSSIPEEPSPVSSPKQAPQLPLTDDQFDQVWHNLYGPNGLVFVGPEELPLAAVRPSSSSLPSGPADGRTDAPSPGSLTESGHELMKGDAPHAGPSGPASSTMSSVDHESMGAHAPPNPGPSTESDHEMVDVPPSLGSASPIKTDHEMVDALPSLTESVYEMVNIPPSSSVSSTKPNRQSMGADSSSDKRKKIKLT